VEVNAARSPALPHVPTRIFRKGYMGGPHPL
jgi:hypothetical protein